MFIKSQLEKVNLIPKPPAGSRFSDIELLSHHREKHSEERIALYTKVAILVRALIGKPQSDDDPIGQPPSIEDLITMQCRHGCNNFTICDDDLRQIGGGIYPLIALVNHSCEPNCCAVFDGKQLVLRSTELLEPSTELTISYLELAATTSSRQKELKERYFFTCTCNRCTSPEEIAKDKFLGGYKCPKGSCKGVLDLTSSSPSSASDMSEAVMECGICHTAVPMSELQAATERADNFFSQGEKAQKKGETASARTLFEQCYKERSRIMHRLHVDLLSVTSALLSICIQSQDFDAALTYVRQTIAPFEYVYQGKHPLMGIQYFMHGKLAWWKEETDEAVEAYEKAIAVLAITHGPHHSLVLDLVQKLAEAKAEQEFRRMRMPSAAPSSHAGGKGKAKLELLED